MPDTCNLGAIHHRRGWYEEALGHCATALSLAEKSGRPRPVAGSLCFVAGAQLALGRTAEAVDTHHEALSALTLHTSTWLEMQVRVRLGGTYAAAGRHAEARREFEAALALPGEPSPRVRPGPRGPVGRGAAVPGGRLLTARDRAGPCAPNTARGAQGPSDRSIRGGESHSSVPGPARASQAAPGPPGRLDPDTENGPPAGHGYGGSSKRPWPASDSHLPGEGLEGASRCGCRAAPCPGAVRGGRSWSRWP
ncbi:tetratricopeptide repeat protein [Streptomyces sp. NPDC012825]|uniref:tetratricopeptide repeat protein n=1 Tax=Streptomyces sp. NPDC012825 TaxID=3364851 RepID=UPI00367433BA